MSANTTDTVGNQFGYLCPQCLKGFDLTIRATVTVDAALTVDGTDNDGGDTEWDDNSGASCACGWEGQVKNLMMAENFEEDMEDEDEDADAMRTDWPNHFEGIAMRKHQYLAESGNSMKPNSADHKPSPKYMKPEERRLYWKEQKRASRRRMKEKYGRAR